MRFPTYDQKNMPCDSQPKATPDGEVLLAKGDPKPPAMIYHLLKHDIGSYCALMWALFGNRCDHFENCLALF